MSLKLARSKATHKTLTETVSENLTRQDREAWYMEPRPTEDGNSEGWLEFRGQSSVLFLMQSGRQCPGPGLGPKPCFNFYNSPCYLHSRDSGLKTIVKWILPDSVTPIGDPVGCLQFPPYIFSLLERKLCRMIIWIGTKDREGRKLNGPAWAQELEINVTDWLYEGVFSKPVSHKYIPPFSIK